MKNAEEDRREQPEPQRAENTLEDWKEQPQLQHAEKRGGRLEGASGTTACGKRGSDTKGTGADETEERRIQQLQRTKQRWSNSRNRRHSSNPMKRNQSQNSRRKTRRRSRDNQDWREAKTIQED